jgi:5'(3')-deoxyribonucleotidase
VGRKRMKIVYVDMDSVLVNFQSGIDALTEEQRLAFKNDLDDVPGIFSMMKPVDGAVEAYKELTKHFDVYILSTAPWNNPSAWTDKLLWVKKYLGDLAYKRLILSHNKNLNSGDYLIDDRTANGAGEFKGEHIHFLTKQFRGWDDVLSYLIPNANQ